MNNIVFPEQIWEQVCETLEDTVETAGVLFARSASGENELTLLSSELHWVSPDAYLERTASGMTITSKGYVALLREAANRGFVPIFLHTHPGQSAEPSDRDKLVNRQLRSLFASRSPGGYYASLIIGGAASTPSFSGRVARLNNRWTQTSFSKLRVIGRGWKVYFSTQTNMSQHVTASLFQRQVLAFGNEGQKVLSRLKIGVVGAGGTGSAVCELLIRAGVGTLIVIDPDIVEGSNLSRLHEARDRDVGLPKVAVVKRLAAKLGGRTKVTAVQDTVVKEQVASYLRHCDVIFGCTDDNAGRAILSRLAYWYLIPVIDMGFVIRSSFGKIEGLFGRVTTVMPGEACLVCRGRVDSASIRNEVLTADERHRLIKEGYVPELGNAEPSVGAYTTLIASLGINEMLSRIFGYARGNGGSELLLRLHDRAMSTNQVEPVSGHYCGDVTLWGRGDAEPMLGQLWMQ